MKTYPICLVNIDQRRVIVIGGGHVAVRKVRGLIDAEASVHLISPIINDELEALSESGQLTIMQRDYRKGDLSGAFLVIAATDDMDVNHAIWEEAQQEGCLINVVDDPAHCNFILPALVRRGDLTLAVSSGGASPALARRIRERLEEQFGQEYEDFTALMAEIRPELLANTPPGQKRLEAALGLIDSKLIDVLKQEGYAQAKRYALKRIKSNQS